MKEDQRTKYSFEHDNPIYDILALEPFVKTLESAQSISRNLDKCKNLASDFSLGISSLASEICAMSQQFQPSETNSGMSEDTSQYLKNVEVQISDFSKFMDLTSEILSKVQAKYRQWIFSTDFYLKTTKYE